MISVRARGGTSWGAVWGALFLSCLSSVLLALALIGYMLNHSEAVNQLLELSKEAK